MALLLGFVWVDVIDLVYALEANQFVIIYFLKFVIS